MSEPDRSGVYLRAPVPADLWQFPTDRAQALAFLYDSLLAEVDSRGLRILGPPSACLVDPETFRRVPIDSPGMVDYRGCVMVRLDVPVEEVPA